MVDRWLLPFEQRQEAVTVDEFNEMVGEREIPFKANITPAQVEKEIAFHDFEQDLARFESRPVADLLGGTAPAILDPVSVGTMGFGGGNLARAAVAKTFRSQLMEFTGAGIRAGVASAIPEQLTQSAERVQTDGARLAGSVFGPIALGPILGSGGVAARAAFRGIRDGPLAAAHIRGPRSNKNVSPDEAVRAVNDADEAGFTPLRVPERKAPPPVPRERLNETFKDYAGGHVQWVRDLAAGREGARTKAADIGVDPDGPEMRRMVKLFGDASDTRSATPTDYNFKLLDTFNQFRQGEQLDPDQIQLLSENGLTQFRSRTEVEIDGRSAAVEIPAPTAVGRRLAEALDAPRNVRNAKLLRRVNTEGAGAVRRDLEARARREAGEPPEPGPRIIDDQIDPGTVIQHLEAAGMRRVPPEPEPTTQTPPPVPEQRGARPPNQQEQLRDLDTLARKKDVDLESVDTGMTNVREAIRTCRNG